VIGSRARTMPESQPIMARRVPWFGPTNAAAHSPRSRPAPVGRWAAMIARVKYVSRFSRPMSQREIESIVARAQEHNARIGVTGVLLAFGEVFMQIIEGPPHQIDGLLARISRDRRHRDVVVVRRQEVEQPLFGGWSMRLLELGEGARRDAQPLLELIRGVAEGAAVATTALHELDDLVWRTMNDRASALRRAC
jgi:FAD-dependent sensor of blue light